MFYFKGFRLSEFIGFLCGAFFLLSKVMSSNISFILSSLSTTLLPFALIFVRVKGFLPILIIRILVPAIYLYVFGSRIISSGLDIPNAIRSHYDYIEGQPQNLQIENKNKSQRFTINGTEFKIETDITRINTSKIYRITYLPNSKYVIDIDEVKYLW